MPFNSTVDIGFPNQKIYYNIIFRDQFTKSYLMETTNAEVLLLSQVLLEELCGTLITCRSAPFTDDHDSRELSVITNRLFWLTLDSEAHQGTLLSDILR